MIWKREGSGNPDQLLVGASGNALKNSLHIDGHSLYQYKFFVIVAQCIIKRVYVALANIPQF